MKKFLSLVSVSFFLCCFSGISNATPVSYTDQKSYLSALALLGGTTIFEGFEDDSIWGSTRPSSSSKPSSVSNQGITWSAYETEGLGTHGNYGRTGDWGIYDINGLPSSSGGTSDNIGTAASSATGKLFGIGGFFKSYNTTNNDNILSAEIDGSSFGSVTLNSSYTFFGVIDSMGMNTVNFKTTYDFGADDFTISTTPEPTTILLFGLGLLSVAGVSRRKN